MTYWEHLGDIFDIFGISWGHLEDILGTSWGHQVLIAVLRAFLVSFYRTIPPKFLRSFFRNVLPLQYQDLNEALQDDIITKYIGPYLLSRLFSLAISAKWIDGLLEALQTMPT